MNAQLSSENYLNVCRFCLMQKNDIQTLSNKELATSRIPILYRALMDSEINISTDYPAQFCNTCIKELEGAVQIREHFKKIEKFWSKFLNDLNEPADDFANETNEEHFHDFASGRLQIKYESETQSEIHNSTSTFHNFTLKNEIIELENVPNSPEIEEVFLPNEARKENKPKAKVKTYKRKTVQAPKKYSCEMCKIKFSQNKQLKEHVLKLHKLGTFKIGYCDKCGESFRNRTVLLKHLYEHIAKKCDICNMSFECVKKWLKHRKQHYPNDPKVYSRAYQPRRIKIEAQFNYKWMHCQYCKKGFTKMQKLFVHQRVCHMELTAIECYRCKEKLLRMNRLQIHLRKRHRNDDEPSPDDIICHMCGLTVRKPNFRRHIRVSHANGRIPRQLKKTMNISKCFYCSETFRMEVWLHKHVETIHPQYFKDHLKRHSIDFEELKKTKKIPGKSIFSKKKFQCTTCGIPCENSQMLKEHRDHHKNHECNICKKKFFGLQNLETHLKQHSDKDRPFICEVCKASFTREPHLKDHFRRKHTTERPFTCNLCDKSFANRYEMLAHTRIFHLKIKRFPCAFCDKAFTTANQKKYHETKHTGVSMYVCEFCSKACTSMTALEMHIGQNHHGFPSSVLV